MNLKLKKLIDFWLGGAAVALLYLPVRFAGLLLKREHRLTPPRHLAFVKLLGGGSLLYLLPTIQSLKATYPQIRVSLVCSRQIKAFAETYGVFDEIQVLDDKTIGSLIGSSLRTLLWLFQNIDTTIDLEVHSRLTTIFTTISLAPNRIGLVDHRSLWRKRIYSHAVYTNPFQTIYDYYDAIAALFDIKTINLKTAQRAFREQILKVTLKENIENYFCVGVGCSDLALERMLTEKEWSQHLEAIALNYPNLTICFLGNQKDSLEVEKIVNLLSKEVQSRVKNLCGKLNLQESCRILIEARFYIGIDSALVHLARFLEKPVISFWGPTNPTALMRPLPSPSLAIYKKLLCSPCVHLTEKPPCNGQNICNQHSDKTKQIIEFIQNDLEIKVPAKVRHVDFWTYYPDNSETPRRLSLEVEY
ncbi:MAG: glycosyltransferase family 9 protein [Bdellovibrionia bacterium]